jgi:hypothetical protein
MHHFRSKSSLTDEFLRLRIRWPGSMLVSQSGREMTATNHVLDGMDDKPESIVLSAITEAVAWRHALENVSDPNFLRRGQRVITHPKTLTKFATVMSTGNVNIDRIGGHEIAYERIFAEAARSTIIRSSYWNWILAVCAEKISIWMEDAKQVAVGGYKQVLEYGPDKCSSERDSENSDHGEQWEFSKMYTPERLGPDGKPKNGGLQVLSSTQAFVLRAAAQELAKASGPSESCTPSTSGTEGEDSVDEWYCDHPEVPKCGKKASSSFPTPMNSEDDDSDDLT